MTTKKQLIARLKFALKQAWKIPDEILDYVDFDGLVDETLGFYENLAIIMEEVEAIRQYAYKSRKEHLMKELSEIELSEIIAILKLIEYVREYGDERYNWVLEELENNGVSENMLLATLTPNEIKALANASITVNDVITVYVHDQAIIIPKNELSEFTKEAIKKRFKYRLMIEPKPKDTLEEIPKETIRVKLPCSVDKIGINRIKEYLELYEMKLVKAYDNTIEIECPKTLIDISRSVIEDIKAMCPKVRREIEREKRKMERYREIYYESMKKSKLSETEIEEIVKKALSGLV